MRKTMFLSYDPEGDILEVVFDENLHRAEQVAYKLRQGMILYVTADKPKPVQLTLGNYRTLMQFPHVKFEGWKKLSASDKKLLKPILASPTVSAFLRLDPETGYGHLAGPGMPEILSMAA
jgi:hypothetical protein